MLSSSLLLLILIPIASARIYEIQLSVDDDTEWIKESNVSIYFLLTTTLNGEHHESPAYIIEDGLPGTSTYSYSLLLDDLGDASTLRIYHFGSNKLCFSSISVDQQTASRDYDCTDSADEEFFQCMEIVAYLETEQILHAPDVDGCLWSNVVSHSLMKEYTIEITMNSSYYTDTQTFYHNIGILLEGFVFESYFTPFYNLSSLTSGIYNIHILQDDKNVNYDKLELTLLTYDVTPIESIWIVTQNTDALCIDHIAISVSNNEAMDVRGAFNEPHCVSYPQSIKDSAPNGCSLLGAHFRSDTLLTETQPNCEIADTSFTENNEQRASTNKYTLTMDVSEGTTDYIFYQMEGHTGEKTECFYTSAYQLPVGLSVHQYNSMRNIGNPKKLYLLHDRNDDICINYIKIHNDRTNDTILHEELICSDFLYEDSDPGRCNVITVNFEQGNVTNVVSETCPFSVLCEFGLYEEDMASNALSATSLAVLLLFIFTVLAILLSLLFGYKCIWCQSVYSCLIHCWDPFVVRYWNPKCEEKCCHCPNTTDMQHNLCCYCCGCDYCNPFGIHRRRLDQKNKNEIAKERKRRRKRNKNDIAIDEYDSEDGALNLTAGKYDMRGMAGDSIGHEAKQHVLKSKYSSPSITDDDEEDELGDFGDALRDSDSMQLKTINMDHETDDERLKSTIVDEYDR